MQKYIMLLLSITAGIALNSCCKGGSGGNATLICSVTHHSKGIPGSTVYIKYNAKDFPGTSPSSYDAHYTAAPNSNTVTIPGLNCGDYFLYGAGFDSSIMQPVSGGLHYQIKYSERKKQESVTVAVTE
jgi:hypothetical protein